MLTSRLRFELVDDEERALLGSYAIASAVGVAFLLLVQFGPHAPIVPASPSERGGIRDIIFTGNNPFPEPTVIEPASNARATGSRGRAVRGSAPTPRTGAISSAFSTGGAMVGQPTNILGAVVIAQPGASGAGTGGKTVLAPGLGGAGSIAPGRGGIAAGAGGSGAFGGVQGQGGVERDPQRVSALAVVPVEPLSAPGDAAAVGTFVRGNESQLRFCYEENGLAANPRLAGSVTIAITVAANGAVTAANVTKRSWSGAGAAESEACIVRAIRGWRLPASGGGSSTYAFPFNFSR
jgi:hypothetical protein